MRTSKVKRMMARPTFPDELALHRVDCLGSNGLMDNYEFLLAKQQEFHTDSEPLIPPRLITGHDVMKHGVAPGPEVGALLQEAQDLQLEGTLVTREQAEVWLVERLKTPLPAPAS